LNEDIVYITTHDGDILTGQLTITDTGTVLIMAGQGNLLDF